MSDNVFPALPLLDLDIQVSPAYSTKILQAVSGKEVRVSWRTASRTTYSLKFQALRTGTFGRADYTASTGAWTYNPAGAWTEYSVVQSFVATHRGSWDSFLWVEPLAGAQVRVRFLEDSIVYKRIASGYWAVDSLKLITVL